MLAHRPLAADQALNQSLLASPFALVCTHRPLLYSHENALSFQGRFFVLLQVASEKTLCFALLVYRKAPHLCHALLDKKILPHALREVAFHKMPPLPQAC